MWALIQKTENGLPTAINCNSESFADCIQSGYEILEEGTRRDMLDKQDELIIDFANQMD